jgi:hypothetical protein
VETTTCRSSSSMSQLPSAPVWTSDRFRAGRVRA